LGAHAQCVEAHAAAMTFVTLRRRSGTILHPSLLSLIRDRIGEYLVSLRVALYQYMHSATEKT